MDKLRILKLVFMISFCVFVFVILLDFSLMYFFPYEYFQTLIGLGIYTVTMLKIRLMTYIVFLVQCPVVLWIIS